MTLAPDELIRHGLYAALGLDEHHARLALQRDEQEGDVDARRYGTAATGASSLTTAALERTGTAATPRERAALQERVLAVLLVEYELTDVDPAWRTWSGDPAERATGEAWAALLTSQVRHTVRVLAGAGIRKAQS